MTESIELENLIETTEVKKLEVNEQKATGKVPEVILYYAAEKAYDLFEEKNKSPTSNLEIVTFSAIPISEDSPFLLSTQDVARIASERGYVKHIADWNNKSTILRKQYSFLDVGLSLAKKRNYLNTVQGLTKIQKKIVKYLMTEKKSDTSVMSDSLNISHYTIRAATRSLKLRNLIEINKEPPKTGGMKFVYNINESYTDIIDLLLNKIF